MALTSINKKDNRQAALAVLEHMTTAEFQGKLSKASGNFAARSDVPAPKDSADYQTLKSVLEFANPGEPNPAARQVMAALAPYIQSALRGDMSAKEAMTKAAEESRAILDRN